MSTTYYEANRILDRAFGATAISTPGTLYFGLSASALDASGAFTGEPTIGVGAYARATLTNNKTNWDNAASGSLSNLTSVSFPESTTNWGTMISVFIADGATVGANMLYFATLSPSRSVVSGTTLFFDIGAIVVTMT